MKLLIALGPFVLSIVFCGLGDRIGSGDQRSPSNQTTGSTPGKTADRETVKNDLLQIANDMSEAAKNGDITFLAQNTTDDFELTDVAGKVQNKNKALADVKEERAIRSATITEPELASFGENDAVLKYVLHVTGKNGRSAKARITDSFVKRNGKWMLRSEQQTLIR